MKKKRILILMLALMFFPLISVSAITKVNCGNITGIPEKIPEITNLIITITQIAVPVVLVITGSLDLFKGITAQKEDEIKKGQQMLVKRLITAVIIFFLVVIVKFVISLVADSSTNNITNCIDCFLNGTSNCSKYVEEKKDDSIVPVNNEEAKSSKNEDKILNRLKKVK